MSLKHGRIENADADMSLKPNRIENTDDNMKTEIDGNGKIQYVIARALTAAAATAVILIIWTGILQSASAEVSFAPMYFIGREDFEKQEFTVTEIDSTHYEIENLSREDIAKSIENGDGIWHDSLSSPAGSHISGMLVYFEEGLAVMQVEPENMRGMHGNIINVWKTKEKYVHTIDFNMVGETYIIDEPGTYGMEGEVLETNPEIIKLYWVPETENWILTETESGIKVKKLTVRRLKSLLTNTPWIISRLKQRE